jgi:NAD(P)-dependent dehydrogenase (short-subunit alcohol dehydrogenase family)
MTLERQIAWVTGAGSGIGRAIAIDLARAGACVVISGRRNTALEQVADEVRACGGLVQVKPADVRDGTEVETVAAQIVAEFGPMDILVNAAGINVPQRSWAEVSQADWLDVNATNMSGPFFCTRSALLHMRLRRRGLIINIGSWGGRFALKLTGAAYAASKRALMAMTETLNMEEGGVTAYAPASFCPPP